MTLADTYRIEKDRLEVTLTMVSGTQMRGAVFVPPRAGGHLGRPEPAALFNESEPFVPLELPTGEVMLVAKARVVEVSGIPLEEGDAELRASSPMALLEIKLAGGVAHFGSMRLEVRADRPRLLDYLNDCTDTFIMLYTDNGVRLVNRALIECVRPLD